MTLNKNKFTNIIHSPAFGGALLFLSAIVAFVWANMDQDSYHSFWHHTFWRTGGATGNLWNVNLHHVVNELLMAIFFFFTGLEIKKEIVAGELSSFNKAILPIGAAIGGMVLPWLKIVQ